MTLLFLLGRTTPLICVHPPTTKSSVKSMRTLLLKLTVGQQKSDQVLVLLIVEGTCPRRSAGLGSEENNM